MYKEALDSFNEVIRLAREYNALKESSDFPEEETDIKKETESDVGAESDIQVEVKEGINETDDVSAVNQNNVLGEFESKKEN